MTQRALTAQEQLQRQRMLLEIEYLHEKRAFQQEAQAMGVERRVKRGDAWFPVQVGRTYFNSLNQRCVEIFRQTDEEIEHNFEHGRPVAFFTIIREEQRGEVTNSPSKIEGVAGAAQRERMTNNERSVVHHAKFTGTVSYVDGNRMVVSVPDNAPLLDLQQDGRLAGVQLSFDETSYRAMFDALDRTIRAKDNRLAELRTIFFSRAPLGTFSFEPMRLPWLNPTQEKAVNQVLRAKDVAIVHGPPGTGKTTTLVEAIHETLRRENQVLVCAQSNMAVDWISERLVDRGISVLRIGNPTRVNDKMLSFTYERQFESHPDYPQLWAIRKAIRELRAQRKGSSQSRHQKLESLRSRATELEVRINSELFDRSRVIASTLVGADNRLLMGQKFGTLFIDEAAQALEAACWIPLRRVHRVVFAGDHCQLPPTVKSLPALKAGLAVTLMERLVDLHPEAVTLLRVQYRMNEQIMRFSSEWFYGGRVVSAPQIKHRSILDYDHPIQWIDTPDDTATEQFVGSTFGRINPEEAALTLQTLRDYFTKIGRERILGEHIDVGIISPYRAQVQHLRRLIRKDAFLKPFRSLISVNTVDGFQGQERDVIIISMVRSNADGQIGFLRDLRRMNVAITRARMKLIILGNVQTLTRHPFYQKLYEYINI